MEKYEAIIFDLGGVILNIDYHLTRAAFEVIGVKNFHEMYSQADANDLFKNLETGKISEDSFYTALISSTGIDLPTEKIQYAWNAMLLNFREKSLLFLKELKPKYKLFLLSNTNHIHLKEFRKIYLEAERAQPFEALFDKVYYSCEIALRKPDAECYQLVLAENKLEPGRTLFVDDSAQNVEAARILGMQTILLPPNKNIEDLFL
ncbi:MAG: HAD family phosphatase [Ginsengibacter sp.]